MVPLSLAVARNEATFIAMSFPKTQLSSHEIIFALNHCAMKEYASHAWVGTV
jgi:hypothetical protein